MFHSYWSLFGRVPRDTKSKDKERCRRKYKQLIRRWRVKTGLPVDDDPGNAIQPGQPDVPRRRKRGGPSKRSTWDTAPRPRRRRQLHVPPAVTGTQEETADYAVTNPRTISDDGDSDWNDNIRLLQRSRPNTGKRRLGNMSNVIDSIFGNKKPNQGLEESAEDDIKEEDVAQDTVQNTSAATATVPAGAPALRARSICTPLLSPISDPTSEIERQPQTMQGSAPTPIQADDGDTQFNSLRNALTEHFNASIQENTQETTQETMEDDIFLKGLEAAATMVEGEAEVKKDEHRIVTLVPCPITPMSEVIVIDD